MCVMQQNNSFTPQVTDTAVSWNYLFPNVLHLFLLQPPVVLGYGKPQ